MVVDGTVFSKVKPDEVEYILASYREKADA
jgi:NADH:ubiquinone oxidoreductase subunit E